MSQPFEILEHTADIGLRAFGGSSAELFENAAAALLAISYQHDSVAERETREIAATGDDRESLLVNWLQELVWLIDGEGWLPHHVTVREITATAVKGIASGEPRDGARHDFHVIVKAITYHQLAIREKNGQWTAEVYLDI